MTQEEPNTGNMVLDFNFEPAWARRPVDKNPYAEFQGRTGAPRGRKDDTRPGRFGNRPGSGARDAFSGQRRRTAGDRDKRGAPRSVAPTGQTGRDAPDSRSYPPASLLEVSFIPERRGLKPLARLFSKTAQAYALMEVASMFLSRPEFHAVKLEVLPDGDRPPPFSLYQCKECHTVFTSREQAVLHGLAKHFELFYDREETQVEPPKGKFVCVARCGLSRALLGPPNYHEFNERLLELHRTRYASIPFEEYRNKVVNDADPAAIEQWKQEVCRMVTYRTRPKEGSEPVVFKRRLEVESHFREQAAPGLIREGHRFIVSGPASRAMDDPMIAQAIQRAWFRENRFPLKIAIALHPAFRSYGLTLFKTPDKTTFVTAIQPRPIDPSQALEIVRRILECLVAHPGLTRSELGEALFPGATPSSPPIVDIINQLRWLIDRGHVIEFSNGKLAVPYRPASVSRPPAPPVPVRAN